MADAGTRSSERDTLRLWTAAFVLAWAANFLHSTAFYAFVHLPGWLEHRGAGEALIGSLIAVMSVAAIISRPLIGRLMDTRGRRIVVLVGGVIHILATAAYLFVDAAYAGGGPQVWTAVTSVRIVHGVAEAMLFSVLFTYAADIVPAGRRAQGIALFGISGMLPLAVGGLLGDWLIVDGDYAPLLWTALGCAVVGLLVSLPLPETRTAGNVPTRSFVAAVLAVDLRPLWFMGVAFSIGLAAYFTFLKTYLIAAPQLGSMGLFFGTYALAAVVLRLLFGWVPERLGLARVLYPSLSCGAIGLTILAMADGPGYLIAAGIACGIGHGYSFPILSALVVTRAQPDERGSAISFFTALFDLGMLIGGPTFGLTVGLVGYPGTFLFAALLVVVATLIFIGWERRLARQG